MTYATREVDVPDGRLTVGEWKTGERPVLAIHGVSSTHKLWLWTAAHLRGYELIAPDLRGRGASQGSWPRYGIGVHAEDMLAVLDRFGVERAIVAGMSLGGFVAVRLAASHPERVERLLLVDGGLPVMTAAAFKAMTREQVAGAFRDRFQRIEQTWPTFEAYRDFVVKATMPLLSTDDPLLAENLRYDLEGDEPDLRVRLDGTGMADDAADVFLSDDAERAAQSLTVPTHMLYAEWSSGRGTPPAYTAEYLEPWRSRIPGFKATMLPGTDHAASVMTASSGTAIAAEIDALARVAA